MGQERAAGYSARELTPAGRVKPVRQPTRTPCSLHAQPARSPALPHLSLLAANAIWHVALAAGLALPAVQAALCALSEQGHQAAGLVPPVGIGPAVHGLVSGWSRCAVGQQASRWRTGRHARRQAAVGAMGSCASRRVKSTSKAGQEQRGQAEARRQAEGGSAPPTHEKRGANFMIKLRPASATQTLPGRSTATPLA